MPNINTAYQKRKHFCTYTLNIYIRSNKYNFSFRISYLSISVHSFNILKSQTPNNESFSIEAMQNILKQNKTFVSTPNTRKLKQTLAFISSRLIVQYNIHCIYNRSQYTRKPFYVAN